MRFKDRMLLLLVPPVAACLIRLLHLSIRTESIGVQNLRSCWDSGKQVVISFWHDQLLLMVMGYPGKGAKLLISESKDGELLARTMKFFQQDTVRGSSSRGGRAAFRQMVELSKDPADIVLTPDGPRGPRHQLKDGVVQLARLGGRPVIPMAFACSRGHRFASWDKFLFPYPFSKGVYAFGEPVVYDREEGVDAFRERLISAMEDNQRQARAHLEAQGVSAV